MASMSKRKFSVKHPVVVDVGCSCRRTKLSSLFFPTPTKPKLNPQTPPKHHHPLSSYYPFSPSTTTNFSTTTSHNFSSSSASPYEYSSSSPSRTTTVKKPPPVPKKKSTTTNTKAVKTKGRVVKESVAVVKESEDPYHDFRESMMQMILEKEIYAWEDLRELLHRFLSLNSPYHHDSILRAFSEIWNDVFSSAAAGGAAPAKRGGGGERKKKQHHHLQKVAREETRYFA